MRKLFRESTLVNHHNAHGARGTGDHAHSCFQRRRVQVGHLQLGDLLHLSLGDVGDLVPVGTSGRMLQAAGLEP